jgi:hypothetical protein
MNQSGHTNHAAIFQRKQKVEIHNYHITIAGRDYNYSGAQDLLFSLTRIPPGLCLFCALF